MALSDTTVRLAKAGDSDRKLADGKGLYLLVTATGSKLWRLKYRICGKDKKLALGACPEIEFGNSGMFSFPRRNRSLCYVQSPSQTELGIGNAD